jgi:hypothetical protein
MLGTKTARQLHKGIGATVVLATSPSAKPTPLRVVGIGMLPTIESDAFAVGAALTRAGLEALTIGNGGNTNGYLNTVFRLAPGVERDRALAQLREHQVVSNVAAPPGDVRNLDLVRAYPLWLAGFLAALGLLTVTNALLVSARRRSQQVGVLRALGLTRGQVVKAVTTQGAAMCLVGALVGVPIGVAIGRWTWVASAHQLGVGEGFVVPVAVVAAVLFAGLALLVTLGATAGWWAGRSTPGRALRVP